jgi:light-regulated signal transduction histidine kinase (bacteriophytochrome)
MSRGPVDVRRIVLEVLAQLQPELAGRELEFVLGELPPCDADPVLLRQVYANLIGNAVKFTRDCEAQRVEIGSHEAGGIRTWFVADNGVGFDMAFADKLFETFQRLHRSDTYEGTGIGLALVRLIVQRHGGEISVAAAENAGARFSFTLPPELS